MFISKIKVHEEWDVTVGYVYTRTKLENQNDLYDQIYANCSTAYSQSDMITFYESLNKNNTISIPLKNVLKVKILSSKSNGSDVDFSDKKKFNWKFWEKN